MKLKIKSKILLGIILLTSTFNVGGIIPKACVFAVSREWSERDRYQLNHRFARAVEIGDVARIRELLTPEVDINMIHDRYGRTLLYLAVVSGHVDMVRTLLNAGVNVNATDDVGVTPLHLAVVNGSLEMVQELLGAEAVNVNAADELGNTPLHLAAVSDRMNVVQALLNAGADVNLPCRDGLTALDLARMNGNDRVAAVLNDVMNVH